MNRRLQSRCLASSALAHAVLIILLIAAPGFRRRDRDLLLAGPPMELVPGHLIAQALAANSAADSTPSPSRPESSPPPAPPVQVPPPRMESAPPPAPEVRPNPSPRETATAPATPRRQREEIPPDSARSARNDRTPSFDFSKARAVKSDRRTTDSRTRATEERSTASSLQSLDRRLASAASTLARSSSRDAVQVRISGGGGGGSANAWSVRAAYDAAWQTPQGVRDSLATAEAEVVIRGDGTVVSARLVRESGISALDRSAEQALRKVKKIEPFEGFAASEQVTFILGFNLRSRGQF